MEYVSNRICCQLSEHKKDNQSVLTPPKKCKMSQCQSSSVREGYKSQTPLSIPKRCIDSLQERKLSGLED